jgi:hypothetical protein
MTTQINQSLSWSSILHVSQPPFNGYLTPDALMTYCQTRMQGLDTQIQSAFAKQNQGNADSAVLCNLANGISLPNADLDLTNQTDFETALHTAQQMDASAHACQDPATSQALQDAAAKLYAQLKTVAEEKVGKTFDIPISDATTGANVDDVFKGTNSVQDSDKKVTIDQFKQDTTGAIQNIQQDLNSSNELSMINLQSLMSQRQESIQLCTNLVQALGDQVNKVADNVGK